MNAETPEPTEAERDLLERISSNCVPDRQPIERKLDLLRAHVAAETAALREELRIAEGRAAIEISARESAVESRKKFASELQQLADVIIGGENVPAPFDEVLAKAEELRPDSARLEFLMAGGEVKVKQPGRNYSLVAALHYRCNRHDVDAAMHTASLQPERLRTDASINASAAMQGGAK